MKRRLMALFLALTMLVSMAPGVSAVNTGFSDVVSDAWYAEAVKWAVENGITGGIGDGKFGPDQTCTRGQVVTFLWAAAGKHVMEKADNPFADVSASDWYYNAVMWAVENNITGGTSATTFSPEAPCTRAQVVTFLYAAEGKPAIENTKNDFADVAANDWFYAPVMWAVQNGITGGIGNGKFGHDNPCTRGQIALFLYKASLVGDSDVPEVTPNPATVGMGYAICELEFVDTERQSLRTVVSAESACVLITEVLSEDGTKQLTQVETAVAAGTVLESIEIRLPPNITLPEYVLLRGNLQDGNGNPLSNPFVSREYTEAYERFAAQMETDFAPERVIDVMKENDGNFVVIHEDVLRIEQTNTVNVLRSRGDGICVFERTDETLRGLKAGDKILIADIDGQYAGVIVDKIKVDADGVVEIHEKVDVRISDFYALIKIEANLVGQPQADAEPQLLNADMGPLPDYSDRKYLDEIEVGPAFTNELETIAGSVEATISVGAKLKYEYDPEILGKDYLEYSFLAALTGELDLTIAPDVKFGDSIEIASVPLLGLKEFAEVPVELNFVYDIDMDVGGTVTVGVEAVTGFVYQTDTGVQRVEYKETVQRDCYLKESVKIKFGLRASIGAEFFDGMFEVYLGAECGVDLTGEMYVPGSIQLDTDSYHACQSCFDGYAKGYFEIEIAAEYDIDEWLRGTVLDFDIIKVEWNIGAFHLSILNTEDSVYKGALVFAWGKCPNRKYRVQIVTCQNGEEVSSLATLKRKDLSILATEIAQKTTPFTEYLYPGVYYAYTDIGVQHEYREFTVDDNSRTIKLEINDPVLTVTVVDSQEPIYIGGASVVLRKDGEELCTLTEDSIGQYSGQVKPGDYIVTCGAKDYFGESQAVSLTEDESLLFYLVKKDPGKVTGTVSVIKTVDGETTYVPVEEAVLTVYSREEIALPTVVNLSASDLGAFTLDLPLGDYSLMVKADGCDVYETDFTVGTGDVELPIVMRPAGSNEEAYAAYVPMVEKAIRDTKECFSFYDADDADQAKGYLADLDEDGVDELLMEYYYEYYYYNNGGAIARPVYSVYDYEGGELVTVVDRKVLIEALAGGELGSAAVVNFDGKPTIMIMDNIGSGGGPGVTHLYNYEFYDYPSMERKYLLGYWQEEGESGLAAEKFYINDAEITKERLILEMTRCPELKFSQRGYDFYCGDPMSLNETLKAVRGPVIYKGTVYADKFTEGVTDKVPVPNAEIKLWCWDDETETEIGDTVYADEKGCFEIDLTDVQGYDAEISAEGYISKTTSFSADDEKLEASIRLVPDIYEAVVQAFMDKHGYNYMDTNQRNRSRGMLCDLNGDGQDELIMRAMQKDGRVYENTYEIWTMENGETKLLLEYTPNLLGEYLSIVEYNGNRYFALEEVSPGTMAVAVEWRFYDVNDTPYELFMHLDYWEMHDGSEGAYAIDGQNVTKAEIYAVKDNITTVFELFKEWEGGYDGYPLYEFVYQKVG